MMGLVEAKLCADHVDHLPLQDVGILGDFLKSRYGAGGGVAEQGQRSPGGGGLRDQGELSEGGGGTLGRLTLFTTAT